MHVGQTLTKLIKVVVWPTKRTEKKCSEFILWTITEIKISKIRGGGVGGLCELTQCFLTNYYFKAQSWSRRDHSISMNSMDTEGTCVTWLSTFGTCIASAFPEMLMRFLESPFIDTLVALSPFKQHFLLVHNAACVIKRSHAATVKASDFKRPLWFPEKAGPSGWRRTERYTSSVLRRL